MYLSIHLSVWFVILVTLSIGGVCYFWGRRDERRDWVDRLGRR